MTSDVPEHPASPSDTLEEDKDESEEAVLDRLRKLPKDEYYRTLGKIFVLKVWSWASQNWWVTSITGTAKDQSQLDAKKNDEFISFLEFEIGLDAKEYSRPRFRKEVFFYVVVLEQHH